MRFRDLVSFVSIIAFLVLLGCGSQGPIVVADTIQRTSFTAWELRQFPNASVSAEVPSQARLFDASDHVTVGLHEIPPPPGMLADAMTPLVITLERTEVGEFLDRQESVKESNAFKQGSDEARRMFTWTLARHDTLARLEHGSYFYYRYDVPCPDGKILVINGELLKIYVADELVDFDEDDAAIRRIMSSARCLEKAE